MDAVEGASFFRPLVLQRINEVKLLFGKETMIDGRGDLSTSYRKWNETSIAIRRQKNKKIQHLEKEQMTSLLC